ncbi:MAG: hypothetical protein ACKOGA_14085 [Planctomycetaceae bacterium]
MGETGFFGFAFNRNGQRHYAWGELKLDPTSANTDGYGFQITRAYYNDTPGASIAAGDTDGWWGGGGGGALAGARGVGGAGSRACWMQWQALIQLCSQLKQAPRQGLAAPGACHQAWPRAGGCR